jgi:hypothetical protein
MCSSVAGLNLKHNKGLAFKEKHKYLKRPNMNVQAIPDE